MLRQPDVICVGDKIIYYPTIERHDEYCDVWQVFFQVEAVSANYGEIETNALGHTFHKHLFFVTILATSKPDQSPYREGMQLHLSKSNIFNPKSLTDLGIPRVIFPTDDEALRLQNIINVRKDPVANSQIGAW